MRWQQGRDTVDGMIGHGDVERVPASRDHAEVLLGQARQHLDSARAIAGVDPAGGYQLLYHAARKARPLVAEAGVRWSHLHPHGRRWRSARSKSARHFPGRDHRVPIPSVDPRTPEFRMGAQSPVFVFKDP